VRGHPHRGRNACEHGLRRSADSDLYADGRRMMSPRGDKQKKPPTWKHRRTIAGESKRRLGMMEVAARQEHSKLVLMSV
jgi:predicted HAD superfamily Cof-like phosphohydrolase